MDQPFDRVEHPHLQRPPEDWVSPWESRQTQWHSGSCQTVTIAEPRSVKCPFMTVALESPRLFFGVGVVSTGPGTRFQTLARAGADRHDGPSPVWRVPVGRDERRKKHTGFGGKIVKQSEPASGGKPAPNVAFALRV